MAITQFTTADLARRLDILISVVAEGFSQTGGLKTATKIYRLADLGLSTSEISGIVGKNINYVSATLHQRRDRAKKRKGP